MEPILSNAAGNAPRNAPRDLLSRLYREIGISAVAGAIEASTERTERPSPREKRAALAKSAA